MTVAVIIVAGLLTGGNAWLAWLIHQGHRDNRLERAGLLDRVQAPQAAVAHAWEGAPDMVPAPLDDRAVDDEWADFPESIIPDPDDLNPAFFPRLEY